MNILHYKISIAHLMCIQSVARVDSFGQIDNLPWSNHPILPPCSKINIRADRMRLVTKWANHAPPLRCHRHREEGRQKRVLTRGGVRLLRMWHLCSEDRLMQHHQWHPKMQCLHHIQRWTKSPVCFAKHDPSRAVKQNQEEKSRNHVQAF